MAIENRLAGKVALVTGGSRGIGAEIVRRLAAEGADVGFTHRTGKDEAQQVADRVRDSGRRALTVQADLAEPAAAAAVAEAVVGEFGRLDILVNNAGITHWGALAQTSLADFARGRQRPRSSSGWSTRGHEPCQRRLSSRCSRTQSTGHIGASQAIRRRTSRSSPVAACASRT